MHCNTLLQIIAASSITTAGPVDPCSERNCSQGTFCEHCTGECDVINNVDAQCVCEVDWAGDNCGKSDIVKIHCRQCHVLIQLIDKMRNKRYVTPCSS